MRVDGDREVASLAVGNMRRAEVIWDEVGRAGRALGIALHGLTADDPSVRPEPCRDPIVGFVNDVTVDTGGRWRPPIHEQTAING